MISSEVKMRVAQNCHGYRTRHCIELISSLSYGTESCSSCINYVRGECTEELFHEIRGIISIN
ncbi:MAG: hypothetical protein MUO60_05295 [Clostridiaceae bacterium]|nr:hypothetical protein [Clostridiaceae bacterium]